MRDLINKNVLTLIIFLHTIFFLFLLGLVMTDFNSNKKALLEDMYIKNYNIIKQETNFLSRQADIIFDLIIDSRVREILSISDKRIARDLLYEYLKEKYEKIKKFYPILHFHYMCYSFLRFYDIDKYGDFLGDFRKSICKVLNTKKPYKGFEIGRYGVFYRNIYYLTDKYTVEVAVDFFDILRSLFKESYLIIKPNCDDIKKYCYKAFGGYYSYKAKFDKKLDLKKKVDKEYFIYKLNDREIYIVIKIDDFSIKEIKKYYLKLTGIIIILYAAILVVILLAYKYFTAEIQATHDPLTGLLNRSGCKDRVRYLDEYSVLMIDIDHFKKINDTYGHDVGDEVLKEIAEILRNSLRKTDIICRWGGEEFVVILPYTKLSDAVLVANNLRKKIEEHKFVKNLKVTVSIGVSELVGNFEVTLKRADEKLYLAKKLGRNRIEF